MPSVPCWPLAYLEWLFTLCLALQQELPLSEALAGQGDGIPSASESERKQPLTCADHGPRMFAAGAPLPPTWRPSPRSTPAQDPSWPSKPCTSYRSITHSALPGGSSENLTPHKYFSALRLWCCIRWQVLLRGTGEGCVWRMRAQKPSRGSCPAGRWPLCPQHWLPCVRGWGRGQCLQMLLKLVSLQGFGSFHHGDLETRARGGRRTQWGFQYPGLGRQGARLLQLSLQAGEGRGPGEAGPELPI